MITKELTHDQINMLSEAILAHIASIRMAGDMSCNRVVSDACTVEIGKLRTLLNYINE